MPLPSRARVRSVAALGLLAALAPAGCSGTDKYSPGTKLGTFHVHAALASTSCGAARDPWEFDVRLSHDGSLLYWVQGGAPVQGRVDREGRATLEAEVVEELRAADPKRRTTSCTVARKDRLTIALRDADGAEAADPATATAFAGALVYTFAATDGSDCADQVAAGGGDFDALPCELHYDVTATSDGAAR